MQKYVLNTLNAKIRLNTLNMKKLLEISKFLSSSLFSGTLCVASQINMILLCDSYHAYIEMIFKSHINI